MDNCCFNRPFDDKKVFRNRLEADAKLQVQRDFSIKPKDALHLACALTARAVYFLTTDQKFLAKIRILESIRCINPVEWIGGEDL
jgi:predicted nucleic acid-binding protein